MPVGDDDPPGLDLRALERFLAAEVPELATGRLRAKVIAGGKSNLTYEVTDGAASWIVRRPPLGHVLATAHDMGREYRVLSALRDTPVPVPRTYVLCSDPEVLGVPFYVMSKVDGVAYRTADQLAPLGPVRVHRIGLALVDNLVSLHAVDFASVGLADLGHPAGYLGRQVRRWRIQLEQSYSRDLPQATLLHDRLAGRAPEEFRQAVVHGDFRLDNLLFDAGDRLTAVLDWEMATLGDPLADLASLCAYDWIAHNDDAGALGDAAAAAGFPGSDELVVRYAEVSGLELPDLAFYRGLAFFKLAAIFEGLYYRYRTGQTVGEGFAGTGGLVPGLLEAGLIAIG